jgi:hypothetical protein
MSKGIDILIDALVVKFISKLWVGETNVFKGRIQRVTDDNGDVRPKWFDPSSESYTDVLLQKSNASTSFFDVQSNEDYNGSQFIADVWICFAINLKTLYPAVSERATEYAHEDVLKIIKKYSSFKPIGLVRELNAFSEYNLVKESDNMNQFYLFRINTTVKYPQKC